MVDFVARMSRRLWFFGALLVPLLAGSSGYSDLDPEPAISVAGAAPPVAAADAPRLSNLAHWQQLQRDRMSPTDLPGATGSAQHPSLYGPKRHDPRQGIPDHAYSPFSQTSTSRTHCPSGGCDYATDGLLIKLEPDVDVQLPSPSSRSATVMALDEPSLSQALADHGISELEPLFPGAARPATGARSLRPDGEWVETPDLTRWVRVRSYSRAASLDIETLVETLSNEPGVALAEPDYLRKPIGTVADLAPDAPEQTEGATQAAEAGLAGLLDTDPRVSEQWHLEAANIPAAWQHLADQGLPPGGSSDVVVAVIDTGVDYEHQDLAASMWVNAAELNGSPGVDDDGNGYVDDIHGANVVSGVPADSPPLDDHGHGTHVAGIIAAQADNGVGGTGVAPNTRIMAIKAAQYSGVLAASDIARGIYYAVEKGADVINMSFGGYARSSAEEDALTVAFGNAVLVAAAGNDGRINLPCPFGANLYPAAYNWVLGVMSRNESPNADGGYLSGFSNRDCVAEDASEYELMAPGSQILSTLPGDGYGAWSGTSMATPVVAGIAALARTQWPDKQTYSSRFIMGQIAATGPALHAYTPLGGMPVFYRQAQALNALSQVPQPSLSYLEHYLFDTTEVDAGNDNDGIVDAGETVELAIVIRNHWGKADNVQVTLEAQASGAAGPDPYVTMLNGTVDYGAVGSFNNDDNGLTKDAEGAIVGVEHPFSFQVAANTPNDHLIPFQLTMTGTNGYDPGAGNVTSYSSFYLLVQRGRELPRIISADMTLNKDDYWLVSDATLIEEGVTVTVTEGTQIQFFSVDPEDPYADQARPQLQVEGGFLVRGTVDEPVEIFTGLLYPAHPIQIRQVGNGNVDIAYARISNPVLGDGRDIYTGSSDSNASPISVLSHSELWQQDPTCIAWFRYLSTPPNWDWSRCFQSPRIVASKVEASRIIGLGQYDGSYSLDLSAPLETTLLDSNFQEWDSQSFRKGAQNSIFLRNNKKGNQYDPGRILVSQAYVSYLHEPSAFQFALPVQYDGKTYVAISPPDQQNTHGTDALQYLDAAEAFARQFGGNVVTVEDQAENDFLYDYRVNTLTESAFEAAYPEMDCGSPDHGGPSRCWDLFDNYLTIGLVDRDLDGTYEWLSGETASFTNWSSNTWGDGFTTIYHWDSGRWTTGGYVHSPIILELPGIVTEAEIATAREQFLTNGWYSKFYNNAILNDWNDPDVNHWMRFFTDGSREAISSLTDNYWGTTSTTLIEKAIWDANDDFNLGTIQYEPILTTAPETAYPFVVDVNVSTSAGPASEVGAEPVSFSVTFNRDMDTSVQPQVSFGPAEPYTDYGVEGDWTNARTWVGDFNVTPITGDGEQSIRVAGAVAADDAWLVTGNDFGRFRFEIITSGTEGMNLQASGGEGFVDLWWSQNDFDTLAGYNLYRSTSPDSGFGRINETTIPFGLTTWRDDDVQPGQPYYYYFTVVETGLGAESDPSNTATATPTDTIPPVVSHTPITQAAPGQPLSLSADATDNVAVQSVTLYHRAIGGASYSSRAMVNTTGDRYSATLEGSLLTSPGIEYYIEASDGISVGRSGRADLPWQVVVEDKPTVTSVSPNSGSSAGGTNITITGTNFKTGATVTFGGAACGSVTRVSSTQLTCTTPAHFPEQVDVIVTNPDAQTGTLLRGFTFSSDAASLGLPDLIGGQGQMIEVPISAANLQGLTSATLTLSYDSSLLANPTGSLGNLTPGWSFAANSSAAGQVTLSMASGGGSVSGSGILARLEFEVIGAPGASGGISLSAVSLNDGAIPAETAGGSVTVDDVYSLSGTLRLWNQGRPLADAVLTLSGNRLYSDDTDANGAYTIGNVPAGDYSLSASHDQADNGISALDASLALQHDAGLSTLSGHALAAADVNQNGDVTAQDAYYMLQRAVGLIDLPFQGAGAVWLFEPAQRSYTGLSASLSGQDFTAILLGDPSGNWDGAPEDSTISQVSEAAAASAILSLPQLPIHGTGPRQIPVGLDLSEGSVRAIDLEIHYDPALMRVVTVDKGDLGADWQLAANLQTAGLIRVSLAGSSPITATDALALVRLGVEAVGSSGAQGEISLVRGDLDEGGIPAARIDGAAMLSETFSDTDLVLGGIIEGTAAYAAQASITTGSTMAIAAGASVTMRAGTLIRFQPGFSVRQGASLSASIDPGLAN